MYDQETGLYYLQSRYYNPSWGRFINADTTAVLSASPSSATWDKNLFAYCDNNPVSRKDDGGQIWHCLAIGTIEGITSFVATLLIEQDMNKALISLACGFVSGVASAALPGVGGLVAGVVVGTVEESLTADNNYEEFRADLTVSTAVDLLSGVSSEESRITKQVVQEYRKAIPKSKAGNHPVVKSAAKKVKKKFGVMAGKEIGTGVAQKSFWGVLKKGLQAIF